MSASSAPESNPGRRTRRTAIEPGGFLCLDDSSRPKVQSPKGQALRELLESDQTEPGGGSSSMGEPDFGHAAGAGGTPEMLRQLGLGGDSPLTSDDEGRGVTPMAQPIGIVQPRKSMVEVTRAVVAVAGVVAVAVDADADAALLRPTRPRHAALPQGKNAHAAAEEVAAEVEEVQRAATVIPSKWCPLEMQDIVDTNQPPKTRYPDVEFDYDPDERTPPPQPPYVPKRGEKRWVDPPGWDGSPLREDGGAREESAGEREPDANPTTNIRAKIPPARPSSSKDVSVRNRNGQSRGSPTANPPMRAKPTARASRPPKPSADPGADGAKKAASRPGEELQQTVELLTESARASIEAICADDAEGDILVEDDAGSKASEHSAPDGVEDDDTNDDALNPDKPDFADGAYIDEDEDEDGNWVTMLPDGKPYVIKKGPLTKEQRKKVAAVVKKFEDSLHALGREFGKSLGFMWRSAQVVFKLSRKPNIFNLFIKWWCAQNPYKEGENLADFRERFLAAYHDAMDPLDAEGKEAKRAELLKWSAEYDKEHAKHVAEEGDLYKIMLQAWLEFEELHPIARYYWNFHDIAVFGGIASARPGDLLAKQGNSMFSGTAATKKWLEQKGTNIAAVLDEFGSVALLHRGAQIATEQWSAAALEKINATVDRARGELRDRMRDMQNSGFNISNAKFQWKNFAYQLVKNRKCVLGWPSGTPVVTGSETVFTNDIAVVRRLNAHFWAMKRTENCAAGAEREVPEHAMIRIVDMSAEDKERVGTVAWPNVVIWKDADGTPRMRVRDALAQQSERAAKRGVKPAVAPAPLEGGAKRPREDVSDSDSRPRTSRTGKKRRIDANADGDDDVDGSVAEDEHSNYMYDNLDQVGGGATYDDEDVYTDEPPAPTRALSVAPSGLSSTTRSSHQPLPSFAGSVRSQSIARGISAEPPTPDLAPAQHRAQHRRPTPLPTRPPPEVRQGTQDALYRRAHTGGHTTSAVDWEPDNRDERLYRRNHTGYEPDRLRGVRGDNYGAARYARDHDDASFRPAQARGERHGDYDVLPPYRRDYETEHYRGRQQQTRLYSQYDEPAQPRPYPTEFRDEGRHTPVQRSEYRDDEVRQRFSYDRPGDTWPLRRQAPVPAYPAERDDGPPRRYYAEDDRYPSHGYDHGDYAGPARHHSSYDYPGERARPRRPVASYDEYQRTRGRADAPAYHDGWGVRPYERQGRPETSQLSFAGGSRQQPGHSQSSGGAGVGAGLDARQMHTQSMHEQPMRAQPMYEQPVPAQPMYEQPMRGPALWNVDGPVPHVSTPPLQSELPPPQMTGAEVCRQSPALQMEPTLTLPLRPDSVPLSQLDVAMDLDRARRMQDEGFNELIGGTNVTNAWP
ncbi:hypothetical protein AURDEDRAFT_164143 [Auricularia subglabra TFB-10046 SS5]|nr:hypothetical protein AURDEDRAFT_164143 [Auricularia subglabra TFB-10046 SS5]